VRRKAAKSDAILNHLRLLESYARATSGDRSGLSEGFWIHLERLFDYRSELERELRQSWVVEVSAVELDSLLPQQLMLRLDGTDDLDCSEDVQPGVDRRVGTVER